MKETLPYGELWLLERVVEIHGLWLPLGLLPDSPREREIGFCENLDCPLNGLSLAELADVMSRLFVRGEVEFEEHAGDKQVALSPVGAAEVFAWLVDASEQHRRGLREDDPLLCYGATGRGIARWERHAVPNWNKYRGEFVGRLYEGGETTWSQTTATESFAREVLEVHAAEVWQPAVLHWDTVTIEHHVPWEPFRGKVLPSGVTVSVKVTERGQQQFTGDQYVALLPFLKEHDRRFREICRWYENSTSNHPDCPRRPQHTSGTDGQS